MAFRDASMANAALFYLVFAVATIFVFGGPVTIATEVWPIILVMQWIDHPLDQQAILSVIVGAAILNTVWIVGATLSHSLKGNIDKNTEFAGYMSVLYMAPPLVWAAQGHHEIGYFTQSGALDPPAVYAYFAKEFLSALTLGFPLDHFWTVPELEPRTGLPELYAWAVRTFCIASVVRYVSRAFFSSQELQPN